MPNPESTRDRPTVTVTGATGKTGREVVRQAAEHGWRVRRAVRREPEHAGQVRLDWDDEESWKPAFAGSQAAYVLIPFKHPGAAERTPDLIRAAAAAGVDKIVLLSSWDAAHEADDGPLRTTERALLELPVRAAVVRPTWFLDNFTSGSFAAMTAAGELRLPAGDGRIPFVDVRDIAAVAVRAFAADGPDGILPLTGPAEVTHHQVAEALAEAAGRSITYTPVELAEFVDLMLARGFDRDYGEFLGEALLAVASGELRIPVAPTAEQVLGRSAYSVGDFARHHAAELG